MCELCKDYSHRPENDWERFVQQQKEIAEAIEKSRKAIEERENGKS